MKSTKEEKNGHCKTSGVEVFFPISSSSSSKPKIAAQELQDLRIARGAFATS